MEAVIARRRRPSWPERTGLALLAAAVVWFYGYLATSHVADPFGFERGATAYYHYMTDGFLHGRLSLLIEPDPELATLANPYDPLERVRIGHPGLHDASYYHGHYYLYFGAAPTLALFLPFRLLTGLQFPEPLACALFCAGGYALSLALFLGMRRRWFPDRSGAIVLLGALMLGLCNFCVVMLTRAQFYEVPIAAAYLFSCLGLWALFQPVAAGRPGQGWLWLAGIAFGLAIASRPHFVFATLAPGLACLWLWRRGPAGLGRDRLRAAAALGLPIVLTIAGLLVYNALRFDSPLEFGQRYQMAGSDEGHMTLLSWRAIPLNLYYYFWAPARLSPYFPFVGTIPPYPGPVPKLYYGIEDPFGLLVNMPCFLLALLAPVCWWRHYRTERSLGLLLLLFGACFVPVCLFTLFFVSATNRYMVDFLPALLLLAAAGLLMAAPPAAARMRRGALVRRLLVSGAIVYSAFFAVMAAFQHNGLFQHHQPAAYDRIGRWFNRPVAWWERLSGKKYGPVRMTVKFSRASIGTTEPLVVTGAAEQSDYIYLYYTGADSIQVGVTHIGGPEGRLSRPIPVDYDAIHRIDIDAGSLYPPATHPYFSGVAPAAVQAIRQRLRVTIDGIPYVDFAQPFYEATPATTSFGRNLISDYAGRRFKGRILALTRGPLPPSIEAFDGGRPVTLGIRLPKFEAVRAEPLVATGKPGAGDLVFIRYEDATHVRLGFVHAGEDPTLSDPLEVDPDGLQRVEISLGSFYPATAPGDWTTGLVVKFNDLQVWAEKAAFYPAAGQPEIGNDAWRSDACGPKFTGGIVAVHPAPPLPPPRAAPPFRFLPYWVEAGTAPGYGPLRLLLQLPQDQMGKFEPLLVSGPSVSQADYVWMQYVDAGRINLGYEHTGGGGPRALIPLDFGRPHEFELELPSLYPPADSAYFADVGPFEAAALKSHARIAVDGVTRIDARVKGYEAAAAQITPGENRLSTTFGRRFTGRVLRVERASSSPPAGFVENDGPLEIALSWPDPLPAGKTEALLATGTTEGQDVLQISYGPDGHAHFAVRDHQGNLREGSDFTPTPGAAATLRLVWDGFPQHRLRPGDGGVPAAGEAGVKWEGKALLDRPVTFNRPAAELIGIARSLGGTDAFSGVVHSVRRLPSVGP